jgi:hypothetical protein
MSQSQSASRSRLELARDEVDRVFGDGHAAAHPELVVAIVHAASSDWAAPRWRGRSQRARSRPTVYAHDQRTRALRLIVAADFEPNNQRRLFLLFS